MGDDEGQIPGDRQPCPACGEAILPTAKKCRYCGHYLDPALAKALRRRGQAQLETLAGWKVWGLGLGALVGGLYCQIAHSCMCGHLAHGASGRALSLVLDGLWVALYCLGVVRSIRFGGQLGLGSRVLNGLLLLLGAFFVFAFLATALRF